MYSRKQGKNYMVKCTRSHQPNFVMIVLKQAGYEKFKNMCYTFTFALLVQQ